MVPLKDILRFLRDEKGLSQIQVAEDLGIKSGTYSSYENGIVPKTEVLAVLAKYHNVSLDYLCGLSPERRSAAGVLPKKFLQYAEASNGKGFTASDVADILDALTKYYHKGAPAGDLPPKILCGFLEGFTASLNAAAAHDVPALLDAVNAATIAALDMNKMMTAYFERERGDQKTDISE